MQCEYYFAYGSNMNPSRMAVRGMQYRDSMAARLEGPESRINTLLGDAKPASTGEVVSLAERIKALQRDAGRQRTSA